MAEALARNIAAQNPQIALAWARTLGDDAARQASENAVASAWLRKDKANASTFLRASGWTDERLTAAQGKQAAAVWLTDKGDHYAEYIAYSGARAQRLTSLKELNFTLQGVQVEDAAQLEIALEQETSARTYETLAGDLLAQSKQNNWHDKNPVNFNDKNCAQCHK